MKRGTNLETKNLEVRHMLSPEVFHLGLPISISKPTFSNVCGLPFSVKRVFFVINYLMIFNDLENQIWFQIGIVYLFNNSNILQYKHLY